jgi:hypothetical protein
MAEDQKSTDELSVAKLTMGQSRAAIDAYFGALKTAVCSYPTGGTEFGEKLKSYAERNVTKTHEYVKQLSQAKDFQDIVRIQTEFIQSLANAFGEQTKTLTEEFTKTAADVLKKPLGGAA